MLNAVLWDNSQLVDVKLKPKSGVPIYQQVNKLLDSRTMTVIEFSSSLEAYVDDEGLLVDSPYFGAVYVDEKGNVIQKIGGKILFVNHNEEGETISLTYEQQKEINHLVKTTLLHKGRDPYPALLIQRRFENA